MGVYVINALNSKSVTNEFGVFDSQPTTLVVQADGYLVNVSLAAFAPVEVPTIGLYDTSFVTINGNVTHFNSGRFDPALRGAIQIGDTNTGSGGSGSVINIGATGTVSSYQDYGIWTEAQFHPIHITVNNAGSIQTTGGYEAIHANNLTLNNSGFIGAKVHAVFGSIVNTGYIDSVTLDTSGVITNNGVMSSVEIGGSSIYHGERGSISSFAVMSGDGSQFYGGAGVETLRVSADNAHVELGGGSDRVSVTTVPGGAPITGFIDGGDGRDTIGYVIFNSFLADNCTIDLAAGTLTTDSGISGIVDFNFINFENATGYNGSDVLNGNASDNILDGAFGIDVMSGGLGNDTYFVDNAGDLVIEAAGQGTDYIRASANYTLRAGQSVEALTTTRTAGTGALNLTGNELAQSIVGNNGVNTLSGLAGNDVLSGMGGADRLFGGTGNDRLIGGAGADSFYFNTALNAATNVDTITDFMVVDDTMLLENTGAGLFNSLAVGTLTAAAYFAGAAAHDATDRIIYNSATGAVMYDADGTGAIAAVKFAQISTGLALTNADFIVF
jgi:Ca2+-binding RTX toxin-like protein